MKMKFKTAYLLAGCVPMILVGLIIFMISVSKTTTGLADSRKTTLKSVSYSLKEYFQYDVIANGYVDYEEYADHAYVNNLKSEDIEMTLFENDTRLLTSIKNSDGTYFEGTKAGAEIYAAVKSGKDYEFHLALNNILGNEQYGIPEAITLCNDNVSIRGKVVYLPVYMTMFLKHERDVTAGEFVPDISALK